MATTSQEVKYHGGLERRLLNLMQRGEQSLTRLHEMTHASRPRVEGAIQSLENKGYAVRKEQEGVFYRATEHAPDHRRELTIE